jgi:hypothetical protein
MQCSVHNGKIKGRVHWWNHRAMCGRCYGYFTKRVRVVRAPPHARRSTLLDRLRRWLS